VLDVSGFILHRILSDPKAGLEIWPKIKVPYFDAAYSSIVSTIGKFYVKYNTLPSFEDLDTFTRAGHIKDHLQALQNLEVPEDVELDVLFDALQNAYTQKEALSKLNTYLDDIVMMDCEEIKEQLVDIALYLEEKTKSSEHIYTMADMTVFDQAELGSRVPLGLNNTFDAHIGGNALTELVLIGGKKGTGKSVVSVNVAINQYNMGNVCPIFTIEMRAREVYNRCISAMAGVSATRMRKGCPTEEDLVKIAKVRANMFEEADSVYTEFLETKNFDKMELDLLRNYRLKPDNQIIIVDNQQLSLADIDFNLQRLKTQFGDKLKVAVVDYVNQIDIEDMYDWKSQISLSKGLKNLARKYEIVMVAPYQIDDKGEARFARGLLDAPDVAIVLEKHENAIAFETQKIRNAPPLNFASVCDWDTLSIKPTDAIIEMPEAEVKEKAKPKKGSNEDL
jgi:replicative DNA helicase